MMFFKSKKKTRELQQATSEPSYVARDTSLEGNLICDGEIHIDGAVRGSVRAHTCLVDNNGEVHGEITAEIVYVRGRVIGPVTGTHVFIHASAHVEGNVTNETISIENGAYIYGSIRHGAAAHQPAPVPQVPAITAKPQEPLLTGLPALDNPDGQGNVRALRTVKPRT
jgi:cytoskeletal protein CcmA (bactofilin family)